jgi:hypothetical protein
MKQTKQMMDKDTYHNAAMQMMGDKADNKNATADIDGGMQTTNDNAEDNTVTQTMGNNETTATTQQQMLMPQCR